MNFIAGYQVNQKLHESSNSLVYRAHRINDKQSIIVKILKQAYPPPETIAWFKREYEILKQLNLRGVVDAYSWENHQNQWLIVLEDFGGESLAQLMQSRQFTLTECLTLAIQIVEILGQVHQRQIMHKDINPSNIV
jgi:serine/threonine protein kinase